jgi:predicted phosphodiesterase
MKILIISDTHGQHARLSGLEGDVLIHCGDCFVGSHRDHRQYLDGQQPL